MPKIIIKLNENLSNCSYAITEGINNILHSTKFIDSQFYEVELIKNYYSNYNKRKSYSIKISANLSFDEYVALHSRIATLLTRINIEQTDKIRCKTASLLHAFNKN